MPRLTKITTKRGDDGSTDLATGERVAKDSTRIRAVGAVDELNSAIGVALSFTPLPESAECLRRVQNDLFDLGAALSRRGRAARAKGPRIEQRHIDGLEREIESLQVRLGPLENFILPDGTKSAAALHVARAVCRRAERDLVALSRRETIDPLMRRYLNRLSDLLFMLARWENKAAGIDERFWNSRV